MDFEYDDDEEYMEVPEEEDSEEYREKNFVVLKKGDIQKRQHEDITSISVVLGLSMAQAGILLSNYNWCVTNAQEAWFSNEETVRKTLGFLEEPVVYCPDDLEGTCTICFESYDCKAMYAGSCGHLFCGSCWETYISISISDGPGCLNLRCPDPTCSAAVGQDMVNVLVSDENKNKYSSYLLRSYIEANKKAKWCPAPGCDYAVEYEVGSESYDVTCQCTNSFCWNCLEEAHRPVECDIVAKWILKNSSESENVNWILVNSKPCPKCKRPIEKNKGCMHMSCTPPCSFHFCWLCLNAWTDHKDFYSCNRYEAAKQEGSFDEIENRREMAKNSIEKYTHYYERWAANHLSGKKAAESLHQLQTVHTKFLELHQLDIELKFITKAWLQIIECRRVLKWTYAFGYYLPENEHKKRELFEFFQGEAELGLERLHKCAENDLKVYLSEQQPYPDFNEYRRKLMDMTTVTRKYFETLVRSLENGLVDADLGDACGMTDSSKGEGRTTSNFSEGSWYCAWCTFNNAKYAIVCQVCSQKKGAWRCKYCTYFNGSRYSTICEMCNKECI